VLRNVKPKEQVAERPAAPKRAAGYDQGPAWAPWNTWGGGGYGGGGGSSGGSRPKPKPKTLFDMLFN